MDRISVFGGTGFIGSNYAKRHPENVVVESRCNNKPYMDDVLYLISTTDNYNVFSNIYKDVNTNLTKLLMVLPNTTGTFNFVSSWFVYGESGGAKLSEDAVCRPKGFYSITKYCAEQLVESYCETFNKTYRILRLCNIVGGDGNSSLKKNAIETMIRMIKNNEDIKVYDGDNYRNFLHVEDCCDAIKLILEKGEKNAIYNIGAPHSTRIIDIVHHVISKTGSKSRIEIVEAPKFHRQVQAKDFFMNTDKLQRLGFVPKYDIWQTIDKLI